MFPVKKLVIHPDYDDSNLDFDVCVLRIGGTFQNKSNIGIIQPTSSGTIPSGELAIVTGWGATESNGNFVPNLRSLAVKVWSTKNCTDQAANYMTSSGRYSVLFIMYLLCSPSYQLLLIECFIYFLCMCSA